MGIRLQLIARARDIERRLNQEEGVNRVDWYLRHRARHRAGHQESLENMVTIFADMTQGEKAAVHHAESEIVPYDNTDWRRDTVTVVASVTFSFVMGVWYFFV